MAVVTGTSGDDTGAYALIGTNGADQISGLEGDDTLYGLGGDDTLDGGTGADHMYGGAGNDTYVIDDAGDRAIEQTVPGVDDGGTDTVWSSVSYHLAPFIENLSLTGTANGNATGNELDNILNGNVGNNTLSGLEGADTMSGGAGDDLYYVDNAGDIIKEYDGQGADRVIASLSYALSAYVEALTLSGTADINGKGNVSDNTLTGNTGNNQLDGQGGNDWLDGGKGADRMLGGAGDDTYIIDNDGDRAVEYHTTGVDDGGKDTVMSSLSFHLGAYIENLTLTGAAHINGTGNELDNVITGNSGNNTLNGLEGADTMAGGAGFDVYYVDNAGDMVMENANAGTDKVIASVSYALTDNVENLALTGSALNGTGNALANTIAGDAMDNLIDGGAGADRLLGGAGNDTYVVDNDGDRVTEQLVAGHDDGGTDVVWSSVTFHLVPYVENLTLTGTGNINGTGNDLANIVTGNDGNNGLNGDLGADTLIGGKGNDTYYVDNAGDVVTESANEGTDKVVSSVTYTLGANVENLTLTGNGNVNGTGNDAANVITGNDFLNTLVGGAGNDILNGMGGNDVLDGGVGHDTMAGGTGDDNYYIDNTLDVVIENADEGIDTINSTRSMSYTLSANIENFIMPVSTLGTVVTGNDLDNHISGGYTLYGFGGDDVLTANANEVGGAILDGGTGADTMTGGNRDDTYYVDNVGDVIHDSGFGTAYPDTVISTISYVAPDFIERVTLVGTDNANATGNAANNILIGNAGDNVLDGGANTDQVDYSAQTSDITVNLAAGTATGAGIGNDTLISIETIIAGSGNDTLIGSDGNDFLNGADGNNIIDGGAGADTMFGIGGNNIFYVDNAGDFVEGNGVVYASVSYQVSGSLGLHLTSSDNLDGTGGTGSNAITGNDGDNVLNGAAGADILTGGLGADEFYYTEAQTGAGEHITDFSAAQNDLIHIDSYNAAAHGNADPAIFQSGSDVIIQIDATHYIVVENTTLDTSFTDRVEINSHMWGT